MKKTTKLFTAMLALLLILPLTFSLASCNKDKGNSDTGTQGSASIDDSLPALEIKDLGGIELEMLFPEVHADGHYLVNELAIAETASNNIEEAVVLRNMAVENAYNVKIISNTMFVTDVAKAVRNEGFLGASSYSAIAAPINNKELNAIVQEGYLTDFNKLTHYSELDQPWWNHELMQDLSVANARYFASGDIIYSDDFYPYCTYVNTAVAQTYGVEENFYQLVKNKDWTLEKFHELAASVATDYDYSQDAKGEGIMHGAVINANFFKATYYSAGKGVIGFDSKGYPVWQMTKEHATTVLDKAISIVHDDRACVFADLVSPDNHALTELDLFASNKSLFLIEELIISERLTKGDNAVDFKVLPFPLYEQGGDYISVLNDALVIAIPAMTENKEDVCLVLSAMGRESVNTLTPVFFENVLTYRYMQDAESVETLQIILDSTVAPDIATIQKWGGMMEGFKSLGVEGSSSFASVFDTNYGTAIGALEDYCVMLDNYYR